MPTFCLNKRTDNPRKNHEVHNKTTGCIWMPDTNNQIDLGSHSDCHGAVRAAKTNHYKNSDGCKTCCPACNTD